MRQITQDIKEAFDAHKAKRVGNTETDGETVWLHGNKIVERRKDGIYATLAGWNTPTTRERVNGITGAGFHQKDFGAYLDDVKVDSSEWVKVAINKYTRNETMNQIEKHYKKASDLASLEVERLARKILSENPNFTEFVMAMGGFSFYDKDGDPIYGEDDAIKEIDDFVCKWDQYLRVTGEAMRFTANGPRRSDW